jgi:hypothetical protein
MSPSTEWMIDWWLSEVDWVHWTNHDLISSHSQASTKPFCVQPANGLVNYPVNQSFTLRRHCTCILDNTDRWSASRDRSTNNTEGLISTVKCTWCWLCYCVINRLIDISALTNKQAIIPDRIQHQTLLNVCFTHLEPVRYIEFYNTCHD